MSSPIPAAQPQQSTLDTLLATITRLKAQQRLLQAELDAALDQLTTALEAGEIDPSFAHDDWSFSFTKGRLTTTYSPEAKAAIKGIQDTDIAMGRATQKQGDGFWVIKAPSL